MNVPVFGRPATSASSPVWRSLRRDVRIIRICAIALLVIAALTGGVAAGGLLAPTALAVILALVLAPVTATLERCWIPSLPAAIVTVGAAIALVVLGIALYAPTVAQMVHRAPAIVRSVEQKLRPLKRELAAVETASKQISHVTGAASGAAAVPVAEDGTGIMVSVASTAPGILAKIVYVGVLTIFLLALRRRYTQQLILMPRLHANRLRMARICRDIRLRVSGYLFTLAALNVCLAAVTAICLWLAGAADPVPWGIAYGLLNFIPIIGPTVVITSLAVVGFATKSTLVAALLPAGIILGIDTIEAYFIQPLLLSYRLVVSPIAIFVTVATLVWMWGAPSAIIAVPALIFLHAVLYHVPSTRPLAMLLASEDIRAARRA